MRGTLPSQEIELLIAKGHVLSSGIGYVRIRNFPDGGVSDKLRETLEGFEALGIPSWIIDMRGNGGGQMDVPAMSLFIPKDTVLVKDQNRAGEINQFTAIEAKASKVTSAMRMLIRRAVPGLASGLPPVVRSSRRERKMTTGTKTAYQGQLMRKA